MKNIKILLSLLLVLCVAFGAVACGAADTNSTPDSTVEQESVSESQPVSQSQPAAEEPTPEDDGKVEYTVAIVDEGGNPIAGAMVQVCKEACYPAKADEQGIAHFNVPEDDYKVSFLTLPAGYTYTTDEQEFYFESGSTEMTIVLKAAE